MCFWSWLRKARGRGLLQTSLTGSGDSTGGAETLHSGTEASPCLTFLLVLWKRIKETVLGWKKKKKEKERNYSEVSWT